MEHSSHEQNVESLSTIYADIRDNSASSAVERIVKTLGI